MPKLARSLFVALALTSACTSAPASTDAGSTADTGASPDAGPVDAGPPDAGPIGDVTYFGDVRPILAHHCVSCHQYGAIAPFALDTYAAAFDASNRIMEATRDRIMPPFLADDSGSCNHYPETPWLSDRDIAILAAWNAQGAPMGDPSTPEPVIDPFPTLDGEVVTLSTGADYTPEVGSNDDYRCFVAEAPVASGDYFVTGFDFHPGNRQMVHHAVVYAPVDAAAEAQMVALDEAAPGAGYPCYGGPGANALLAVGWAPGGGATSYPEHTGIQLTGGLRMIIQIHYNTATVLGADRSTVDLEVVTSGVTPAVMMPIVDSDLTLPPHLASVAQTAMQNLVDDYGFPSVPVHAYGVFPHMHTLGSALTMEIVHADATEQCLVNVPRWDFQWQRQYFYETPLRIAPTDHIRLTCTFDTRSRSDDTHWGEDTADEMCVGMLYISI